jgi:hypothetical protein
MHQQGRQCAYNVTSRGVLETIVVVENEPALLALSVCL